MSSIFGLASRLFAFALFVSSSQAALLDWAPQTSGTTEYLREVWGADSSNVWAVGNTGTILKYNGTAWSAQTSGTTANLLGVWGTSATNVWAVGSGGTILKWNGTAWSAQTSGTTKDLFAIWGADANNVWAVGGTPQFGSGNVILKWNGTSWSAQTPGVSDVLTSVWGTDASNVWAVGWNGRILKWNGTAWATQTSGASDNFQAIWAADATNLWAVDDNGGIFKGNGSTWSAQTSGTALPLLGVRGSSTTDIRVVGADSAIYKSANGSTWSTEATTASTGFHGVWAADDTHYWAVGFDGAIYAATVAANTNLYSLSVRYFGTSTNLISFNAATTSYPVTVNQELISFAASVDAEGAATQQYQFNGGAYTSFVSGGPLVYKLLQLGANTLNVRVTNGASQKTYTININYVPPAPTLTDVSPAMGSTAGGTSVTLTGTDFTAATGVTFGGTAATAFTVDSATAITATTPPHAAGAVSVVVTTPSGSNTANTLFTYAIANLAPTDITLSSTSIAENNAAGATVGTLTATDPDVGQTQTFSLVAGSGDTDNVSFTIAGNALKLTPVADFETKASYALRIRATDNGSPPMSFEKAFTVTITDVNEAPTISVIANQTTLEDTATGAIAFTIGDPDGLTGLTVSATSSDTTLIPQANIVLGGTDASRTITVTPAANANGSADITVQVSDGMLTASRTFTLAVTPVNDAPSFALPTEQLAGSIWTARDSNRNWYSITSSADGSKLAAVDSGGLIYTSTDSGVTWTARESNRDWYSITSSADGSKLAAVVFTGQIYTSTDSGVTWTERARYLNSEYQPPRDWHSITSSADGSKLAAVESNGQIYTSTDSGVTWTLRESKRIWRSITSSADGSKLAAVVFNGQIFTSTDSGVIWTARESNRAWLSITSSADGNKFAAVENGGQIHTSAGILNEFIVPAGSSEFTRTGFASSISPGPANESTQAVNFLLTTSNDALFSTLPAISADGTLTFTPSRVAGTATVTVVAKDNGGTANGGVDTSAAQNFTVRIQEAPVINGVGFGGLTPLDATVNIDVLEGSTGSTLLVGTEAGVAQSFTRTLSGADAALFHLVDHPTLPGAFSLEFITPQDFEANPLTDASHDCVYDVTVTLTDDATPQGSGAVAFHFRLRDDNDMPSFTKGADVELAATTVPQTRTGWATAISDGDPATTQLLTFNVTKASGANILSAGPVIDPATGNLTFTPNGAAGTATFSVTLSDDSSYPSVALTTEPQTFTITTTITNQAPTISVIANQTTLEDTATGAIAFTIGDPDGLTGLTVSATSSDTTLIPQANIVLGGTGASRTITLTPAANANGSADITVQVSDGILTTSRTFSLAVTPVNDAPSFAVQMPAAPIWSVQPTEKQKWWSVASSADGSKLAAAATKGYLYTSSDFGVTWTAHLTDVKRS